MKKMKKLFALVLALALCFSLAIPAMAANVVNETTHSYKAYQIFTGTQDIGKSELGNVDWGNGVDPVGLIAALKAENEALYANVPVLGANYTAAEGKIAAEQVMAALVATNGEGVDYHADADEFANIVVNYVKGDGIYIAADASSVDLPAGYYIIVDVTEVGGATDANNPALLQVTNKGDILIAKKYNVPVVDKDIVHGESTKKVDEHSIGDTVNFRLTGTMANNLEDFDEYELVFHDAMSAGLTFNPESVVVKVDGVVVDNGYQVVVGACADHNNCTFQVVFANILTAPVKENVVAIKNSSIVTIEYTAVLNENAQINSANPNDVALEFSNDPNWKPSTPNDDRPTGITPWREVKVYTTEVELTKKDGNTGSILTGAEFTITGDAANIVVVSYADFQVWTEGSGTKYWLLKDGTYTETDPASLSNTTDYADTTVVYKKVVVKNALNTQGASPVSAKAYVGDDGKLKFGGLGVGVYTITETVTPAGYNTIDPITLTVTFNENTYEFHYDWSWPGGQSFSTSAGVVVFNNQGSVLPETGGVGTTMFYVAGSILVLGAAIMLIAKKRTDAE